MADPGSHEERHPNGEKDVFTVSTPYVSFEMLKNDEDIDFHTHSFSSDKIYLKSDSEVNGLLVYKENNTTWKRVYLLKTMLDLAFDLYTGSDLDENRASHVYFFFYREKNDEEEPIKADETRLLEGDSAWIKESANGSLYIADRELTVEFFQEHKIGPYRDSEEGDKKLKPWVLALIIVGGSLILITLLVIGIICMVRAVRAKRSSSKKAKTEKGRSRLIEHEKLNQNVEREEMIASPPNPLVSNRYEQPLGEQDQNIVYTFNKDSKIEKEKSERPTNESENSNRSELHPISEKPSQIENSDVEIISRKSSDSERDSNQNSKSDENSETNLKKQSSPNWEKMENQVQASFNHEDFETQPDPDHETLVPQLNNSSFRMKKLQRHFNGSSKEDAEQELKKPVRMDGSKNNLGESITKLR